MQELDAKYALPAPLQPRNQSLCSPFHVPLPQVANHLTLYPETSLHSGFGKVPVARSISAKFTVVINVRSF